jgi:hypothetical protein
MIATMIAAVMLVLQPGGELRQEYVTCLNNAVASAKTSNIGVDGFKDYAHKTCATVEDGFKARLVSFNVKNGMSKKAASDDAQIQLEDYMYTYEEKYRYSAQPQQ